MKKTLKRLLFVLLFCSTTFVFQVSAQSPTEWHKITDPAVLTSMSKIDPYLGHPGTTTTKKAPDKTSLSMLSNKDSTLNITITTYQGSSKSETVVILKKTKGKWYSDQPYSSNKEYIDKLMQKIASLL